MKFLLSTLYNFPNICSCLTQSHTHTHALIISSSLTRKLSYLLPPIIIQELILELALVIVLEIMLIFKCNLRLDHKKKLSQLALDLHKTNVILGLPMNFNLSVPFAKRRYFYEFIYFNYKSNLLLAI